MRKYVLFLSLLFCLLIPHITGGEEIHPSIKTDQDFYNIGDLITLSFELKGRDYDLTETEEDYLLPFEVSIKESNYDKKRDVTTFLIKGRVFKVGEFTIPPVQLIDAKGVILESSPTLVTIKSLIDSTEGAEAKINDIKPQVEIDESRPVWLFILVVIIVVLIIILYYIMRKKKSALVQETEVEIDPYIEAMEELKRIETLNLLKENDIKEHYSLISDLLRTYVGKIFNINALEMTSFETMAALKNKKIEDETGLGDFLNSCDMVKFAKYQAPLLDAKVLAGKAKKIIEEYHDHLTVKNSPGGINDQSVLIKSGIENDEISG